jgi:hypothetical protein
MSITLCIPRVFPKITQERIYDIFEQLDIGNIIGIDIVPSINQKGDMFNRVFIHFEQFFRNDNATMAAERLYAGNEIKVIYDDPWFWKVSLYRKKENRVQRQPTTKKAPRIEFGTTPVYQQHDYVQIAPRLTSSITGANIKSQHKKPT